MSNENIANLYKFQELVTAESKIADAQDEITLVRRALGDIKGKLSNAESLPDDEKAEFDKAVTSLESVSHFLIYINKKTGKDKIRIATSLETELGCDPE